MEMAQLRQRLGPSRESYAAIIAQTDGPESTVVITHIISDTITGSTVDAVSDTTLITTATTTGIDLPQTLAVSITPIATHDPDSQVRSERMHLLVEVPPHADTSFERCEFLENIPIIGIGYAAWRRWGRRCPMWRVTLGNNVQATVVLIGEVICVKNVVGLVTLFNIPGLTILVLAGMVGLAGGIALNLLISKDLRTEGFKEMYRAKVVDIVCEYVICAGIWQLFKSVVILSRGLKQLEALTSHICGRACSKMFALASIAPKETLQAQIRALSTNITRSPINSIGKIISAKLSSLKRRRR